MHLGFPLAALPPSLARRRRPAPEMRSSDRTRGRFIESPRNTAWSYRMPPNEMPEILPQQLVMLESVAAAWKMPACPCGRNAHERRLHRHVPGFRSHELSAPLVAGRRSQRWANCLETIWRRRTLSNGVKNCLASDQPSRSTPRGTLACAGRNDRQPDRPRISVAGPLLRSLLR